MTAVICRELVARRGRLPVLGPLSLTVGTGELWGVVGPNGAGKTTLLRTLGGLEAPWAGSVEVLGRPRSGRGRPDSRVGILHQHASWVPELPFTVGDVVAFGRSGRRAPGRGLGEADRRAVVAAIDRLGLAGLEQRLFRELSGGERQKVQLARLLAQGASLLLLDEPTAGLDLDWQERLTTVVEDLHRHGDTTVVMVTHEVARLPSSCSGVLLLRSGRMVASGAPDAVLTDQLLGELYGCAMEVQHRHGRVWAHSVGPAGERTPVDRTGP